MTLPLFILGFSIMTCVPAYMMKERGIFTGDWGDGTLNYEREEGVFFVLYRQSVREERKPK